MPIQIRYISVVIPISNIINLKGQDWWDNYLKSRKDMLGIILWQDKYLFRDGDMDESGADNIVKFWEEQGLTPKKIIDGKKYWNDLCVVHSFDGLTLPCEWLKVFYITTKQNARVVSHVSFFSDKSTEIIGPTRKFNIEDSKFKHLIK